MFNRKCCRCRLALYDSRITDSLLFTTEHAKRCEGERTNLLRSSGFFVSCLVKSKKKYATKLSRNFIAFVDMNRKLYVL